MNGEDMESAVRKIGSTRPTAYDLFKAIRYMKENNYDMNAARRYANEISGRCRKIGEYGNELIPENGKILTHCNAGALAVLDWGDCACPDQVCKDGGQEPVRVRG